jgi:hypothetical protein
VSRFWQGALRGRADAEPPYFLAYLLLQAIVVLGLTTPRFPDSETYMHVSFTGADLRLPTVPLLYKVLPTDSLRVAGQVLLAAAAWWALARASGAMIADRRVRLALMGVLLTLGLVGPIVNWNSVILSESTAISLTALMIALWLRYAQDPQRSTAVGAIAATLAWTLTRQANVIFGLLITAAAIAAALVWRNRGRIHLIVAIAMVLISLVGLLEVNNNTTLAKGAFLYTLKARIIPNRGWTHWFTDHGMPNPRFDPAQAGRAVPLNPAFTSWLDDRGLRTYVEFMATHPRYTLLDPLPYLSGEQASLYHPNRAQIPELQPDPTPSILSPNANYGRHRDVVPSVIASLLWDRTQIGGLLVLAGAGFGLAWVSRRRTGTDARLLIPTFIVLAAIPGAYLVWLSGGEATHELDRLSVVTAVWVRIGLWLLLAVALDRVLTARRER